MKEKLSQKQYSIVSQQKVSMTLCFKHHQVACPHGQHIQSPAREDATKNPPVDPCT